MWFICACATALAWGAADVFYKKGSDSHDLYSHLKITAAVGLVMGAHATVYWLLHLGEIHFSLRVMLAYLPVSALYILSMVVGYVGLRYLELSIASPVQNSSGAVTMLLCLLVFAQKPGPVEIAGSLLILAGIIGLGVWEKRQEESARRGSRPLEEEKYRTGFVALAFPLVYCLLDALGTFADALYLDKYELLTEGQALLAYEYTFLICAVGVLVFLRLRGVKYTLFTEGNRFAAAGLETLGQFFYVFALASNAVIAAPLIASYSIFSVLFSRVFLKEKLTRSQYVAVAVVLCGIALVGFAQG